MCVCVRVRVGVRVRMHVPGEHNDCAVELRVGVRCVSV